jgi:hypothetical protein
MHIYIYMYKQPTPNEKQAKYSDKIHRLFNDNRDYCYDVIGATVFDDALTSKLEREKGNISRSMIYEYVKWPVK